MTWNRCGTARGRTALPSSVRFERVAAIATIITDLHPPAARFAMFERTDAMEYARADGDAGAGRHLAGRDPAGAAVLARDARRQRSLSRRPLHRRRRDGRGLRGRGSRPRWPHRDQGVTPR